MLGFLVVVAVLFALWIMYGRGALIVYKHQKDAGTVLPENIDKDQVMDALKKDLGYKDAKEIFFDENGEICIAGKNDTYVVEINEGRVFLNDPLLVDTNYDESKALSFLARLGSWRIRTKKKNRQRVEEIECLRAYIAKVFDHNAPVNAHKKYTNMTRARKYSGIVSIICIALAVILLIVAISSGTNNSTIDGIKFAKLEAYSTEATIADAFNDFFADPEWEAYTEDSIDYVKFKGECTFDGLPAVMTITFEYFEDDWFRVDTITLNGIKLNEFEEDEVLTVIFDSYEE